MIQPPSGRPGLRCKARDSYHPRRQCQRKLKQSHIFSTELPRGVTIRPCTHSHTEFTQPANTSTTTKEKKERKGVGGGGRKRRGSGNPDRHVTMFDSPHSCPVDLLYWTFPSQGNRPSRDKTDHQSPIVSTGEVLKGLRHYPEAHSRQVHHTIDRLEEKSIERTQQSSVKRGAR